MRRTTMTTAAMSLAAVLALTACTSTPSGTVLEQGCQDRIQSVAAGETFYFDGIGGTVLNLFSTNEGNKFTVTAPDGALVVPFIDGGTIAKFDLPTTGRYRIHIGSVDLLFQFQLCISVDEDRGQIGLGKTSIDGYPGQELTFHYAGTAGEHLDVLPAFSPVGVYDPDGHAIQRGLWYLLPVDGDYRVVVRAAPIGSVTRSRWPTTRHHGDLSRPLGPHASG